MTQFVTYNGLVGYEIESLRRAAGMEQAALAQRTGISQPVLSRLEKGKAAITVDQLFVLCQALGKKPQDVLARAFANVQAIQGESAVQVTTSKELDETGALLTGAALGAILTLLLSRK
jgi:transcriptional regulator with XRE-family HTH domain